MGTLHTLKCSNAAIHLATTWKCDHWIWLGVFLWRRFGSADGVVVIGTTNRPDILDKAGKRMEKTVWAVGSFPFKRTNPSPKVLKRQIRFRLVHWSIYFADAECALPWHFAGSDTTWEATMWRNEALHYQLHRIKIESNHLSEFCDVLWRIKQIKQIFEFCVVLVQSCLGGSAGSLLTSCLHWPCFSLAWIWILFPLLCIDYHYHRLY